MITIFLAFMLIASTTIGGGYAMIPLIQQEAITIHNWITETDFINILAISQITPGAIAINSATFIGYKAYGVIGGIIASIGFVLPSSLLIFLIAPLLKKYEKNSIRIRIFSGVRPVVAGLIATAVITMAKNVFSDSDGFTIKAFILTLVAFFIIRFTKIRPVYLLLSSALVGIII